MTSTNEVFMTLRVVEVTYAAEDVLRFVLADPSDAPLPTWEPGAHIDVRLPSGTTRSYSLCGDPEDRSRYEIAVLKQVMGRGGSREMHERQLVGAMLPVRGPRNHFPLVEADEFTFIAGGIGITPILPMVREAARRGTPWRLVYLARSRRRMAFASQLRSLPGGSVDLVPEDECGRADVKSILWEVSPGGAAFVCGPEELLSAAEMAGLPERMLHVERFGRPTLGRISAAPIDAPATTDPPEPLLVDALSAENSPFEVELRATGVSFVVGPDESILEKARAVRQGLSFSCGDGYCGTCETRVLSGEPEHRDSVLTDEEKEANESMMICVGRARTSRLVLDL